MDSCKLHLKKMRNVTTNGYHFNGTINRHKFEKIMNRPTKFENSP